MIVAKDVLFEREFHRCIRKTFATGFNFDKRHMSDLLLLDPIDNSADR